MNRSLLSIVVIVVTLSSANAEQNDGRWGVAIEAGLWKQVGGNWDYCNVDQFIGAKGSFWITPAWSIDLGIKYGWTRPGVEQPEQDAGFSMDSGAGLYTRTWQPNLTGTYRVLTAGMWRPWLSAGVGVTRWDIRDLSESEDVGIWPAGAGLRVYNDNGELVDGHGVDLTCLVGIGTAVAVNTHWSLDLGIRCGFLFNPETDNVGMSAIWEPSDVDDNSAILEGLLGITYRFTGDDADGDGIPNARDAVPEEPEDLDGYRDEDGAPDLDNDRDSMPDLTDACPDEAEDFDGYSDEDGCPDPDNDGDRVADVRDLCPHNAEDFDGFQDEDGCPDPDNDGDGVRDEDDLCDFTPTGTKVDATGCPVLE